MGVGRSLGMRWDGVWGDACSIEGRSSGDLRSKIMISFDTSSGVSSGSAPNSAETMASANAGNVDAWKARAWEVRRKELYGMDSRNGAART